MTLNLIPYFKGYFRTRAAAAAQQRLLEDTITPRNSSRFSTSLADPTAYYQSAFVDFHRQAPQAIRDHRHYFSQQRRGFGEDAFHTMWWRLASEFRPTNFLEIGVYRGQVISLVALLAKLEGIDCKVTGISPFSPAGDSVSTYLSNLDYYQDTLENFRHFDIGEPKLLKAYSTDHVAVDLIESQTWDMIYIDGNHDYAIVLKDWQHCSQAIKPGGVIVLDDSGLGTAYKPPAFATGGHPGPSKLAGEIDPALFEEILQVGHNRVFQRRL